MNELMIALAIMCSNGTLSVRLTQDCITEKYRCYMVLTKATGLRETAMQTCMGDPEYAKAQIKIYRKVMKNE